VVPDDVALRSVAYAISNVESATVSSIILIPGAAEAVAGLGDRHGRNDRRRYDVLRECVIRVDDFVATREVRRRLEVIGGTCAHARNESVHRATRRRRGDGSCREPVVRGRSKLNGYVRPNRCGDLVLGHQWIIRRG
jgi:hypothetical protein